VEVTGIAEDRDDLKKNQTCPFPLTLSPLISGPSGQRLSRLSVVQFFHLSLQSNNSSHTNFYQWLAAQDQHGPFICCICWNQHLTPHCLPGVFPSYTVFCVACLSMLLVKSQEST